MDPFLPFPQDLSAQPVTSPRRGPVDPAVAQAKAGLLANEPDVQEQAQRMAVIDVVAAADRVTSVDPTVSQVSLAWVDGNQGIPRSKGYVVVGGKTVEIEEGRPQSGPMRSLPQPLRNAIGALFQTWQRISMGMKNEQKTAVLSQAFTQPLEPGRAIERIEAQAPQVNVPVVKPRTPRP